MKILIVDDNPEARLLLRMQLESNAHEVVGEAETLARAVALYKEAKPQFVVLDLTLEREDGLTILRQLRQLDTKARVIILSANGMERIKREALDAGAAAYLIKPLEEQELLSLLRPE